VFVVGVGVTFVGYTIFYYGLTQVQGGNWGFWDLLIPSKWPKAMNTPRDGS
jgi:hypothetical protein